MTQEDIQLLRASFSRIAPIADHAAALFYERLFSIAPELRPLFTNDMHAQGSKLMAMLGTIVSLVHSPDKLIPLLRNLGRRHTDYGVKTEHFGSVGAALLWTLEQGLGAEYTPAMQQAWLAAFTTISSVMMDAMTNTETDQEAVVTV